MEIRNNYTITGLHNKPIQNNLPLFFGMKLSFNLIKTVSGMHNHSWLEIHVSDWTNNVKEFHFVSVFKEEILVIVTQQYPKKWANYLYPFQSYNDHCAKVNTSVMSDFDHPKMQVAHSCSPEVEVQTKKIWKTL